MGGGASKSLKAAKTSAAASEREINSHEQKIDTRGAEGEELEESVNRQRSPRAERPCQSGNNHAEEHDDANSARSSRRYREGLGDLSREEDEDDYYDGEGDGEGEEEEEEEDDDQAMQLRMLFAQSAMSMDMDNDDLIFNLLYFGGDTSNFASMMNNAAEETVAAHSAGNTPYKLAPATEMAINKLKIMTVTEKLRAALSLQECSICQEEIQVGDAVAEMPGCSHCFHNDCVLKWFTLQSWCPVCRTKISPHDEDAADDEPHNAAMLKLNGAEDSNIVGAKSNLNALFSAEADDRVEEVN